jgi:hypothetical protein
MGADERPEAPLPVELSNFAARAIGSTVELTWSTATETNNRGWDVEKKVNGTWSSLGFVEGAGTSNAPKSYSFIDKSAQGAVSYRLKQIDRNGRFSYSNIVEAVIARLVADYTLTQNFPNPFNPATTISFAVKNAQNVTVRVYNSLGQEVAVVFEGMANAGETYNVVFNAAGLASGTYFYMLQTPTHREVKKMLLMK